MHTKCWKITSEFITINITTPSLVSSNVFQVNLGQPVPLHVPPSVIPKKTTVISGRLLADWMPFLSSNQWWSTEVNPGPIQLSKSGFGSMVKLISDSVKKYTWFTNLELVLVSVKPALWHHCWLTTVDYIYC